MFTDKEFQSMNHYGLFTTQLPKLIHALGNVSIL